MMCQGASCSSVWADKGLSGGDRRKEGMRGGGDGVVTSGAGREIEVDDERGEIKRGMAKERLKGQKRRVKKEG